MADTRKDKRAPVSLKVRFKSATVDEFIEQYCRDVSRGGIFIKSSQPMPVGTLLKFQLQLKDESSLIKGVGRVVWTRSEDDASSEAPAGMGIKFIKMDGDSRVVVERVVGAHSGEPGTFDEGDQPEGGMVSGAPPSNGSAGGFFPNLPPPVLPPPEDRTAVRHAAQFLASALSESGTDAAASREAQQKAEEAQRRTAQIQAQRVAEAEQKKKGKAGEALPSMIIDPSLSIPPPSAAALASTAARVDVDEDRPTHESTQRAPVSERPTAHKEKPKPPKPDLHGAPSSDPPGEDTSITERKNLDAATLAAANAAEQARPKKSNALPYFVIAAVVALAAFLALQSDDKPAPEEPAALAPVEDTAPEPSAEPEPAPAAEPVPDPAPAAPEPIAEPVAMIGVKVTSTPYGAEIFVGNESRGKTPLTVELPEGAPVTIRARSPGRAEATQELTPAADQKAIKLVLPPLPYVLHVDTTPAGATVYVGNRRGTTPVDLELPAAPKGPLKVTARLPGHDVGITTVAATSFQEREGALRSSVALTLSERKVAPAPTDVIPTPTPKPKPRLLPQPVEPKPSEATSTPKPSEVLPTPNPAEAAPTPKPIETAPTPKPIEIAPKPVETAPKPAAPKPAAPKPAAKPKPKPEPGAEPIPDNPFG